MANDQKMQKMRKFSNSGCVPNNTVESEKVPKRVNHVVVYSVDGQSEVECIQKPKVSITFDSATWDSCPYVQHTKEPRPMIRST